MNKTILIILLSIIGSYLKAQTNLDSLWDVWQDESQADTTRLKAIHKIAWNGYLFSQPDSAFYFAQLQYDFAKSNGLKKPMAGALNTQGVSFAARSNYPQAHKYFQKSLAINEELGDKQGIANLLGNIGGIYLEQDNYPRALEYYRKNLVIKEELGNKLGMSNSMNSIGVIYRLQGNYPQALDYYQKSLAIYEELGYKRGIASSLLNSGFIYYEQGNYPQALAYYERSLMIYEELGDEQGIADALNNIGGNYQEQGNYPQALAYYERSLMIYEELGDKKGIANALNDIGGNYQEQGNYPQALKYCQKGFELAESVGVLLRQKEACQCLYDTYKAMGKGNEALVYLEKMWVVEDSLQAEETNKKLQQMEFQKLMLQDSIAKAEEARLVKEAHQEEVRQKNRTRNILGGVGFFALLLAGGFYWRWRYVRKSKEVLQVEKDRSENLLLNILPAEIAEELKEKGEAAARDFDMVSILFTDFKGFTKASEQLSAADLVAEINICFKAFDLIVDRYGIEKIKTIGDAYMAAGGLPVPDKESAMNTVLAGLDMQAFMLARKKEREALGLPAFEMRVGIHTGSVVAGIVGVKKFQYDIWGDTVNTASRMESSGEVGRVNISEATYELVKDDTYFSFESRGKIKAKGKGEIEMFFVSKA